MGCDIHYKVEGKRSDNHKWEWAFWDKVPNQYDENSHGSIVDYLLGGRRNYSFFYLLADVRGYVEGCSPLFKGRGWPEDSPSHVTLSEWNNGVIKDGYIGDHSYTYLTEDDVPTINKCDALYEADAVATQIITEILDGWFYKGGRPRRYDEYRILIGFDS